jgi:hypothetical protein
VGPPQLLIDFKVEDVGDLEVGAIYEHQIASNEDVYVTRRRRREHHLQLMRAGLHSAAQARRKSAANDDLPLKSRSQSIALSQSRRKMIVVSAVPIVDVAVMIAISLLPAVAVTMAMAVIAVLIVVAVVTSIIVIIAVVFVVAVAVILSHRDGCGERQRQHRRGAKPKPEFRGHYSSCF